MKQLKAYPSRFAVYFSGLFLLLIVIGGQQFRDDKVLKEDVVQYYSFLPATFIYGDLSMAYARTSPFWQDKIWGYLTPEGAYVQKYTMGLALMYTPFFLAGHGTALLTGAEADGYSWPYELWLQIGAVVYLFLGLLVLRRLLRCYFGEGTTALVLLALVFATNLFYYTAAQGPMPHAFLFFLISLFLWLTRGFHEQPSWRRSFGLAVVGGLVVLVRPNHLLIWMVPVLYGISRSKLDWWKTHFLKVLVWPVGVFLVVLPQLLYWKHFTGDWIFYTYGEEGFFFGEPALASAWFSFRKGWLVYTPVMGLAVLGLIGLGRKVPEWSWALGLFFAAATYVLVSWWCWWYGGSFGQRAFIDLFPVLAFGLGIALEFMGRWRWSRFASWALLGGFCLLNAFQTFQFTKGILHHDSMTGAAYRASFGRLQAPEGYEDLLEVPDYDAALQGDR